jgi:hypothetical protein
MKNLIEALQIFLKYGNPKYPFQCEHDVIYVWGISPDKVSDEDKEKLEKLGFFTNEEVFKECFISFRYGSC